MRVVTPPMMTRVITSIDFRPMRSPKCPKITAPNGREKYPTASVAKVARVPTKGSEPGKNRVGKTRAAAAAHTEDVWHSCRGADGHAPDLHALRRWAMNPMCHSA